MFQASLPSCALNGGESPNAKGHFRGHIFQRFLGNRHVQSSRPPEVTNSTQQRRNSATMRAVAANTVATSFGFRGCDFVLCVSISLSGFVYSCFFLQYLVYEILLVGLCSGLAVKRPHCVQCQKGYRHRPGSVFSLLGSLARLRCEKLMAYGLLQLRYEHDSSTIRLRFDYDTLQHATRFFVRSHTRSYTRISGRRVLHVD